MPNGDQPCFGFTIRNVGRRLPQDGPRSGRELPRSVEQLTELVGRVPLKDLVRETTDVIERLCIEAALELTGDNRASAAEILGLSRQSLYVKLRRYGLGDLGSERRRGRLSRRREEPLVGGEELLRPLEVRQGAGRRSGWKRQFGALQRPVRRAEILEVAARGVRHPDRQRQRS